MGKHAEKTSTGEGGKGKRVRTTSDDAGGKSVSEKSKSAGGKCVSENATGGKIWCDVEQCQPVRGLKKRQTAILC